MISAHLLQKNLVLGFCFAQTMDTLRAIRDGFLKHMEEWMLLTAGILSHIGGIYCMRLAGSWVEYASYSNAEVVGFVFGTIFFSVSIPSVVYALKNIFWMKYTVKIIIWIYSIFTILCIIGLILSCFTFEGYVYFVWNRKTNISPVITLTSLISMSLCLLYAIICIIHLTRTYSTRSVRGMFYVHYPHKNPIE